MRREVVDHDDAVAALDRLCGDTVRRAAASAGATAAEEADLAQVIRERLLVPSAAGGPARIASYSGKVAPDDDPELGYLKRLYRSEFKDAFQTAVAALPARDRLVLRQSVLDSLGIDALAKLHHVHRATCARWLETARAAILATTQKILIERLELSRDELQSVIRLISSKLDVSLTRVL